MPGPIDLTILSPQIIGLLEETEPCRRPHGRSIDCVRCSNTTRIPSSRARLVKILVESDGWVYNKPSQFDITASWTHVGNRVTIVVGTDWDVQHGSGPESAKIVHHGPGWSERLWTFAYSSVADMFVLEHLVTHVQNLHNYQSTAGHTQPLDLTSKLYWLSWYQPVESHRQDYRPLHDPPNPNILGWWCTGKVGASRTICASVVANDENVAWAAVQLDWPEATPLTYRFIQVSKGIRPNSDRFPADPGSWSDKRYNAFAAAMLLYP